MSAPAPTTTRWERVKAWFDVRFRSPAAIYGLIVFAAFVTIADDHATDAWEVLNTSFSTLVVFFIAHVFAHTLTEHGRRGLRGATRSAVRHAAGMLWASLPAILVLGYAGATGMSVDDATDWCAVATFVVLAMLGYHAFRHRGARLIGRIAGAAATATLGLLIVILEAAFH